MPAAELLLEVGTEEIPDWMISGAIEDLERRFLNGLKKYNLDSGVRVSTDATPRRLVLVAEGIAERQADRVETLKGPPRSIAYDASGNPTKAAEGFARRTGVLVEQLQVGEDDKLTVERSIEGRPAAEILAEFLPEAIVGIYFPKTMYWTGKAGPRFIRPIRWLVALFNGRVVPFEIAGVRSGKMTCGHRRLGSASIEVSGAADYRSKLADNFVILSAADRRKKIETEIATIVPAGKRIRPNARLLATLVNITEYPTAILGGFEERYLALPEEVLETVMDHHQKYFAVEDENGRLQPNFVAVANLDGDPDGIIRGGHERVLRARFNDARFFWDADQKQSLAGRIEDLRAVTFQAKLGSYYEKTRRSQELVTALAGALGLSGEAATHALRAAELAKCDLTTGLVGEFPELQGVVGGLYAKHQGEPEEVADAVYDHYRPAGVDDRIPRTTAGRLVSIADKLGTLGGLFGLGMIPTGSKDPFALRRAAYGIVRILIEGELPLSLPELCRIANAGDGTASLEEFFLDRLRYYLRDVRGHRYDEVNAVISASAEQPRDVAARAEAISKVRPTPNFEPLAVSFKRIENILKQAGGVEKFAAEPVDESLLEDGAETALYAAFQDLKPKVAASKNQGRYEEALHRIASLRGAVDLLFDEVLVMSRDDKIRNNRLAFLANLLKEFSTIADFSEIVSAEKPA